MMSISRVKLWDYVEEFLNVFIIGRRIMMEFDNKQLSFFSSEEFLLKSMIPERFMSEIASIDIIPMVGRQLYVN